MIIGFDAKRAFCNGTGLGNYSRTLINSLAMGYPEVNYRLYTPSLGKENLRKQVARLDNIAVVYPQKSLKIMRDLWRIKGMVSDLRKDSVDIYHGLTGELPNGLRRQGIRGLVTIHDLIFMRHPEYYNWVDVQIYKRKFKNALREADRIIAISERTKHDILTFGDYPEDKIDVIYQSCEPRFTQQLSADQLTDTRRRYHLPARYILNVGTIEERKNILLAVKALAELRDDVSLVVVGRRTAYTEQVENYAREHGLSSRLYILSGVANDDLTAIYQQAECFVYPSRYEGFGLPIIEAIQSGLPVVACTGSCLEEAGGPDCLYVGPDSVDDMAAAILKAMAQCDAIVEKSRKYVARFENTNVAQQVLDIYRRLTE